MYFPRIKLLFTLLLVLSCSGEEDRQLLEILDKTLENKPLYEGYFNDKVNVLKEVLNEQTDPEQVFNLDMRLADAYRANCKDSVLVYLTQAREAAGKAGRPDLAAIVDFRTAVTYVKAGYAVEANDILEHYRNADIPDIALRSYYEAEHTYWGETMAYTSTPESYDNKLKNRDLYREKLFGLTEEGSWHWHNLKREVFHEVSDMENTRKHARAMLDVSSENSREYAEAAYYYAYTFNEPEEKEEWLIRSAIADIMCGTRDYSSLNDLSGLMFRNGDIERAFRYAADHCMVDALYFNGKLRPWQITRLFPEIESAYQEKHQRQNRITLTLLLCLAVPLVTGGLAALITMGSMDAYMEAVRQPKLSPPPALFPIVWTVLYLLMGVSSYLVCSAPVPQPARRQALLPYALQLFFNFVWPLLFFRQQAFLPAFFWLAALWALVLWMILAFRKVSRTAAWLQVPYLLWLTFAGYLNLAVWLLNP